MIEKVSHVFVNVRDPIKCHEPHLSASPIDLMNFLVRILIQVKTESRRQYSTFNSRKSKFLSLSVHSSNGDQMDVCPNAANHFGRNRQGSFREELQLKAELWS